MRHIQHERLGPPRPQDGAHSPERRTDSDGRLSRDPATKEVDWSAARATCTAPLATPHGREQCDRRALRSARWHDAFADAGIGWPRRRHDPGRFAWSADRSRTSLATGRGRDQIRSSTPLPPSPRSFALPPPCERSAARERTPVNVERSQQTADERLAAPFRWHPDPRADRDG